MIKTTKNNLQRNAGGFLLMVTEFGYSGIINSPIHLLGQSESETVFGPKHKSIPLTTLSS